MSKTKDTVQNIMVGKTLVPCLKCGDSPEPKADTSIKVSRVWAKMLAFWKLMSEYTADYLEGHKYPAGSGLKQYNQKQK